MNSSSYIAIGANNQRIIDDKRIILMRDEMPNESQLVDISDLFALLGDINRLRILILLLRHGEMCVAHIAAASGMSESATSHAIRLLRAHRVVSPPRREGRLAYYRLADAHVQMLIDATLLHAEHTQALHPKGDRHSV